MSELGKIKSVIKEKSKNVITDKKAEDLLAIVKKKYPTSDIHAAIENIAKFSELPSWLNSALTINETYFFRHPDQFDFLEGVFKEKAKSGKPLKIFCGGVSSGEEAYSLAVWAQEKFGDSFSIVGVDISKEALEKAKMGIYQKILTDRTPEKFRPTLLKYLVEMPGKPTVQVDQKVRDKIKFKESNIFKIPLERYDIIFFRNILIYFDEEDKKSIFERLYRHLNTEGLFFIGGGELFPAKAEKSSPVFKTSVIKKEA